MERLRNDGGKQATRSHDHRRFAEAARGRGKTAASAIR